ncbi:branched-chain amino acid ABC transporter permease [Oceanobacillus salinisoli]|uniref:branched-chain amino acid ABC transporter permease n=1 Tax=Oceanobacillus salinisoli TaxID=2678611 RepID=UPI0012E28207|nr:branched-chain amino acid ABC transporter permease [Oceanobacillus salinisoli]
MFEQALINGLVLSSVYVLMALGFTMIFGIMKIVNFAHGEFYMLGAFALYFTYQVYEMNFILAIIVSAVLIGMFGMFLEKVLFRKLGNDEMKVMILALGVSIFLQNLGIVLFGATTKAISPPFQGMLDLGFVSISYYNMFIIIISVIVLIAFYFFIKKMKTGQAFIAVSHDEEIASVQGINVKRIKMIAFGIGILLAAFAGALVTPLYTVSPTIGMGALMNAFIVVILGGLGSIMGALWGGIIIGLSRSYLTTYIGAAEADLLIFILIAALLLVKPNGLLGGSYQ